jgi:hypothetical protein
MAPRKPKETGTALVNWEKELADDSQMQSKASSKVSGGNFISFQGGKITFRGEKIPGNALNVVVLDFVYENQLYEAAYDPETPSVPVCYAFSRDEQDMHPHEESSDPQDKSCDGCPHNEFGSAPTGKGKACKNVVRLMVITEDALKDKETIAAEAVAYIKVPVTSKKNWDAFFKKWCHGVDGDRPSFFYVTRVSVELDPYIVLSFDVVENMKDRANGSAAYAALRDKVMELKDDIMFPYPKQEDIDAKQKPKPRANAKFARKGAK